MVLRSWIQSYRYQWIAGFLFFTILSLFHSKEIPMEDVLDGNVPLLLEISQHWPGKSALQIKEEIAKPWDVIFKSIYGYKERQFISDHGVFRIVLKVEKESLRSELRQTIRNLYVLNQSRFPKDVHFPRFQMREGNSPFFIVLEKTNELDDTSEKWIERKLREWSNVSSVKFQSRVEKEVSIEANLLDFETKTFPAVSEVFQSLKLDIFGIGRELETGNFSFKTVPNSIEDWGQISVPIFGQSPQFVESLLQIQLSDVKSSKAIRVNGERKTTMMVVAKSGFQLFLLDLRLRYFLKDDPNWKITLISREGFLQNAKELIVILLCIDLFLFVYLGFIQKRWIHFTILWFVFYLTILYSIYVFSLLEISLGNFYFVLVLCFKLHLPFTYRLRLKPSVFKLIGIQSVTLGFVFFGWIPIEVLKLEFMYCLFLFFSQVLFHLSDLFLGGKVNSFQKTDYGKITQFLEVWFLKSKMEVNIYQVLLSVFFLVTSTTYLLYGAKKPIPISSDDGFMQFAKLEFPNYISEAEVFRITKQVESLIIEKNWTDLLIVIPKPYRSEFYFQPKAVGFEIPIHDLPTEMGYFHLMEERISDSTQVLRFTSEDPTKLEEDLFQLIPWLQYRKEITDVVLCFQPSHDGLEFQTNPNYRVLLGQSYQSSVREDHYILQSNLVGKFLWNGSLLDVKFKVNHIDEIDPYLKQEKKIPFQKTIFDSSMRTYSPVKLLSRYYEINGKPTLEIMVKGKNIHWPKLDLEIHQKLKNTGTHFYERVSPGEPVSYYTFLPLLFLFGIITFRKKGIYDWFIQCYSLVLLIKLQSICFEVNYIQIVWISFFLVILFWSHSKKQRYQVIFHASFLLSILLLFLYPGNQGYFLFSTLSLLLIYGILTFQLQHSLNFLKPKY